MIVKVQHFEKDIIGPYTEQIYANVEKIFRNRDKTDAKYIELKIKGQEESELIPVTITDETGKHHLKVVGAIWLMTDEGKTIEKLD